MWKRGVMGQAAVNRDNDEQCKNQTWPDSQIEQKTLGKQIEGFVLCHSVRSLVQHVQGQTQVRLEWKHAPAGSNDAGSLKM